VEGEGEEGAGPKAEQRGDGGGQANSEGSWIEKFGTGLRRTPLNLGNPQQETQIPAKLSRFYVNKIQVL
jgi:hypothetical protein